MVMRLCSVLAAVAMLAGCQVEVSRRPIGRGARSAEPRVEMPTGPIATLRANVTTSARIRLEITPVGVVRYDGQVLPMLSPNGRFLAVQEGAAPTWPTLLAADGAVPPLRTRIAVYEITDRRLHRVEFALQLPTGLLLGRSAGENGFLVESPRPDGSRWIGLVDWVAGGVEWLVRDQHVNAHAVFTPTGHLVYARRPVGQPAVSLVMRDRFGNVDVQSSDEASAIFPLCTDEPGVVYVFAQEDGELIVRAIHIVESSIRRDAFVLGSIEMQRRIASNAPATLAYQCLAGVGYGLPAGDQDASLLELPVVFFHPLLKRLVAMDRRDGSFGTFPERSFAAARSRFQDTPGYFVATPNELFFSMVRSGPFSAEPVRSARALDDAYIPRASTNPDLPLVVFGPSDRDPYELAVLRVTIPRPDQN